MRKLLFIALIAGAGYVGLTQLRQLPWAEADGPAHTEELNDDAAFARAFEAGTSNIQLQGQGTVVKLLPDDNNGSRHQRFILKLPSGQTLLIAHNIDLAPRIHSLREGDGVEFNGEYEWNTKGGVIHWTHRDPAGRHAPGWLKHGGRTYQ